MKREYHKNQVSSDGKILAWCFVCQQYKPTTDFCKNRANSDGVDNMCKKCSTKYHYEHRNGERYQKYQHNYYLLHREELLPKHRITARNSINKRKQLANAKV